jgi:hypothetical protein
VADTRAKRLRVTPAGAKLALAAIGAEEGADAAFFRPVTTSGTSADEVTALLRALPAIRPSPLRSEPVRPSEQERRLPDRVQPEQHHEHPAEPEAETAVRRAPVAEAVQVPAHRLG